MKPGAIQGSPLRVAPCPVQSDTTVIITSSGALSCPTSRTPHHGECLLAGHGGRDGMDGRANTDALNAALRGCSKTHRQEAAGGGRQWLGGDGGGGGGLAGAGWVAGRGGRRRGPLLQLCTSL